MTAKQTTADICVRCGIRVRDVSKISGVPRSTLNTWANSKPELLEIVALGCVEKQKNITTQE